MRPTVSARHQHLFSRPPRRLIVPPLPVHRVLMFPQVRARLLLLAGFREPTMLLGHRHPRMRPTVSVRLLPILRHPLRQLIAPLHLVHHAPMCLPELAQLPESHVEPWVLILLLGPLHPVMQATV
jgi:hypothetical protein